MKKIISITEVVDRVESNSGELELRATADASYDESKGTLVVELKSFVYPESPSAPEAWTRSGWQPGNQTVNSVVSWEEAIPAAKDIFRSWVKKLAQSLNSLSNV